MSQIIPIEHITVEPPVWCHSCNAIITDAVYRLRGAGHIALCDYCVGTQRDGTLERRQPDAAAVRDLVTLSRLSALKLDQIADSISIASPNTARALRDLATETNRAIERLRRA